jgi:hypothetical protein
LGLSDGIGGGIVGIATVIGVTEVVVPVLMHNGWAFTTILSMVRAVGATTAIAVVPEPLPATNKEVDACVATLIPLSVSEQILIDEAGNLVRLLVPGGSDAIGVRFCFVALKAVPLRLGGLPTECTIRDVVAAANGGGC